MEDMMRRFTQLPPKGKPAADLTDQEKLALCIAAGAPTVTDNKGGMMTVATAAKCAVMDRGDGGYIVAIGPESDGPMRVDLLPLSVTGRLPGTMGSKT